MSTRSADVSAISVTGRAHVGRTARSCLRFVSGCRACDRWATPDQAVGRCPRTARRRTTKTMTEKPAYGHHRSNGTQARCTARGRLRGETSVTQNTSRPTGLTEQSVPAGLWAVAHEQVTFNTPQPFELPLAEKLPPGFAVMVIDPSGPATCMEIVSPK